MERLLVTLAVFALLLAFGCAQKPVEGPLEAKVILAGHVSIGPLCPVEPCPNPPNMTAVYGNMMVSIYDKNSGWKVAQTNVNSSGDYTFNPLKSGIYLVDVTDGEGRILGIRQEKKEVELPRAGDIAMPTVVLDFEIDTGIRTTQGTSETLTTGELTPVSALVGSPREYLNKTVTVEATVRFIGESYWTGGGDFFLEDGSSKVQVFSWAPISVAQCPPEMQALGQCNAPATMRSYLDKQVRLTGVFSERPKEVYNKTSKKWEVVGSYYVIDHVQSVKILAQN